MTAAVAGALAMLVGALMVYLASANQRLLKRTGASPGIGWAGGAALLAGQILLWTWAGAGAAVFIGVSLVMTMLTLAPLLTGWLSSKAARS